MKLKQETKLDKAVKISAIAIALPIAWTVLVFVVRLQPLPDDVSSMKMQMNRMEVNIAKIAAMRGVDIAGNNQKKPFDIAGFMLRDLVVPRQDIECKD